MISANNVTYRVGKKALFEDVNIKFTEGNCYGLIGANGAGKSTFLKILSGQLDTTKGDIVITPGQRLSVLEQDHFKYDENVVMDTVIMGNARLFQIMKEKDAIYAKEDFSDEDGIRASELEAEFAEMDGWEAESNAAMLLNGLGIGTEFHSTALTITGCTDGQGYLTICIRQTKLLASQALHCDIGEIASQLAYLSQCISARFWYRCKLKDWRTILRTILPSFLLNTHLGSYDLVDIAILHVEYDTSAEAQFQRRSGQCTNMLLATRTNHRTVISLDACLKVTSV